VCGVFSLKENLVNKLLILCEENRKKPHFNPYISNPGVKKLINIVNMSKLPLYFHSRHNISFLKGLNVELIVNNKKQTRRRLGSQC
jgi:hypothetical protein